MKDKRLLILAGCLAMAFALAACDDDDDVSCPGGGQPLLSAITASEMVVDAGDTVQLSVDASGANLAFLWSATGGTFTEATSPTTRWVAPVEPGVYTVTIVASGNNNLTASRSLALGVETALMLEAEQDSLVIAHQTRVVARAVGEDLEYLWSASDGVIVRQVSPDTVIFQAPDRVPIEAPRVQVTVVDGEGNANSESFTFTIRDYVPVDHPFYVGVARCSDCHSDVFDSWAQTAHPTADESLEAIGQGENTFCMGCHTVGTQGYLADPALENRAWNDVPLEGLEGVQCENCHGPGSAHAAREMPRLPKSIDAAVCGDCHTDVHHPTYDEWLTSGHARATELTSPVSRASCARCHNGVEAYKYLSNPAGYTAPAALDSLEEISCAVCHDPHGSEATAELREAALLDVVLPDGRVVPEAGNGRLCMTCHNGRRTPEDVLDQIQNGSEHMGPHHSVQGDMLAGTGAYEAIAPGFEFDTSRHLLIADGCVHCHTHGHPFDPLTGTAYTGHTFLPTTEACNECHGDIADFEEVRANRDWDADGTIEGVQLEIDGLIPQLQQAIIDADPTPADRVALQAALDAGEFDTAVGDPAITSELQRAAGYNLFFVEFDQSRGVHNATYAAQLLQQSILALQAAR